MAEDIISIASPHLSAEIELLGAQLFALRDGEGRDLLWNGDPAFWTGRAPILFPIVGELAGGQYRLGEERFSLSRHGFAKLSHFAVVEQTPSATRLRLASDARTLGIYPFSFELDLRFALNDAALTISADIRNSGKEAMPASFGFHPALRWPLPYGQPRSDHRILFEKDEAAPVRRLDSKGLVRPETFPTPVTGRELVLRDDLFANDALIFDTLASRKLTYGAPTGPQIEVAFDGMPYLGLWMKPGAGYICIEPWAGLADPQNYAGDFRDKPGIWSLPPGDTRTCAMTISLKNA